MSDLLTKYDAWLKDDGPAALVIREHLMPVEGSDGVVFPATYAAAEDKSKFGGGYNIDRFGTQFEASAKWNGREERGEYGVRFADTRADSNVCLVDSVGSQANRLEPEFAKEKYRSLVPQIAVKAGAKVISIFEAGHRAGDALLRCTELKTELKTAFLSVAKDDAAPLAKIAPTSLVFGAWDSRDTQVKVPRLVSSTIRAFQVAENSRSANYLVQQTIDYVKEGLLPEPANKAEKDRYSERGFLNALATKTHGGVTAASIRRDATLNLAALRLLKAGRGEDGKDNDPLPLRRYILGLSLVAFTHPSAFVGYLRQGCTLVRDPDKKAEFVEGYPDGKRAPAGITHDSALTFAENAAKAFGVGESKTVEFDKKRAQDEVAEAKSDKKAGKGKKAGVETKE